MVWSQLALATLASPEKSAVLSGSSLSPQRTGVYCVTFPPAHTLRCRCQGAPKMPVRRTQRRLHLAGSVGWLYLTQCLCKTWLLSRVTCGPQKTQQTGFRSSLTQAVCPPQSIPCHAGHSRPRKASATLDSRGKGTRRRSLLPSGQLSAPQSLVQFSTLDMCSRVSPASPPCLPQPQSFGGSRGRGWEMGYG